MGLTELTSIVFFFNWSTQIFGCSRTEWQQTLTKVLNTTETTNKTHPHQIAEALEVAEGDALLEEEEAAVEEEEEEEVDFNRIPRDKRTGEILMTDEKREEAKNLLIIIPMIDNNNHNHTTDKATSNNSMMAMRIV